MDKVTKLKELINSSKNIVVFTGAGISCASGIPDFRSSNGLYNQKTSINIPPEQIISHSFFIRNTELFFDFYRTKMVYPNALPNLAHIYFAELEKTGKNVIVVTQNIDGLHQKAHSSKVLELHGSVLRNYCMNCHKFYDINAILKDGIPKCNCGGIIKPDVVLYEESLDDKIIVDSINAIKNADMLIVVGTSLTVYPAASFVRYYNNNKLVLINKDKTPYDCYADLVINDDIINVINKIRD